MLIWPSETFKAVTTEWSLDGGVLTGGGSVAGVIQTIHLSGGGYWRLRMGLFIRTRRQQSAARAIQAALLGGAAVIDVGPCDRFRPLQDGASWGSVPHSDDTPFSDDSEYGASPITSTAGAGFAVRAVSGAIAIDTALVGGEAFSINHLNYGRRRYVVTKINSQGGGVASIEWQPPLREAVTSGDTLDFNYPSCLMQLAGPQAFPLEERRGWLQTSVEFVEWFGESLDPAPPLVSELAAEDIGSGQAQISWRNPYSDRFAEYEVWRGASGAAFSATTKIDGPTAGTRGALVSVNHDGLAAATYRWYVVSKSSGGDFTDPPAYVEAAIT